MSPFFELRPEIHMVLDDPVVNDRDAPEAIEMGMGVCGLDATMGCPTRVTNALGRCRIRAGAAVDATHVLVDDDVIGSGEGQAPRVVTSILQRFQRGENGLADVSLLADVAEHAAHAFPSLAGTPAQ